MVAISIIILIICALLALVVLAQNPKGGGLAAGFTGAQQNGGVQRTAGFLDKTTWTLSTALMVLCLISAGLQDNNTGMIIDEFDEAPIQTTDPGSIGTQPDPAGDAAPAQTPATEPAD